jgi:integrase/recombinase XerD
MKYLPLQIEYHRKHLQELDQYLSILGYNPKTSPIIICCCREFLYNLEKHMIAPITLVDKNYIKAYYKYLQERPNKRGGLLSARWISLHLYSIKILFSFLQHTGEVINHPMSTLDFPVAKSNSRELLTSQEVSMLYEVSETLRDRAILSLLYGCGLRVSEAMKLDINDIHFKVQLLYVREGKGKKRRVVPMSNEVARILRDYYLRERPVYVSFTIESQSFILNRLGGRLRGESYNSRLKELLAKTTIVKTISPHNLRHSIATHLLENGLSIEYVRDFLGHRHLETTQIYAKVSQNLLKRSLQ